MINQFGIKYVRFCISLNRTRSEKCRRETSIPTVPDFRFRDCTFLVPETGESARSDRNFSFLFLSRDVCCDRFEQLKNSEMPLIEGGTNTSVVHSRKHSESKTITTL